MTLFADHGLAGQMTFFSSLNVMAARLARTLGSLLVNRVSLITALGITREVVGNTAGVVALAVMIGNISVPIAVLTGVVS